MKKNYLLSLYRKVNPSLRSNFKKHSLDNLKILENKFNIDMSFFKKKKVLDIAAGVGDNAINFAKNGAHVTLIDFNEISINAAKKIFKKKKIKNCKFLVGNFFTNINKLGKGYDFINCTGALHHFDFSNEKSLKIISKLLNKNGYLFLAVGTDSGGFQHKVMKAISRRWGMREKDIEFASSNLFKEYIDRSVKYGMRKKDQVINDQFINKTHKYVNIESIGKLLEKKGIKILHSEPSLNSLNGDSVRKNLNNVKKNYGDKFLRQQYYWTLKYNNDDEIFKINKNFCSSYYDLIDLVNKNAEKKNFFLNKKIIKSLKKFNNYHKSYIDNEIKIIKENSKFYHELSDLLIPLFKQKKIKLNEVQKKISNSKKLFKNTSGLTLNYFLCKRYK